MNILFGVTGGIAAYKSCELVRGLREQEHEVKVVMTGAATRFVGPLTFATLSGHPVATGLFDADSAEIDHIQLARWADVILVAPATAQTIARFSHGFADDLLSTLVLAAGPGVTTILAPAMNTQMWENPLVQANLQRLLGTERFQVVEPVEKTLACGETGLGGLADEAQILAAVARWGRPSS
jgi:phosphopantothenoylcysteine decarboxylase/phosphopantothenate--cysteine ligase